jgi:hypothetical protein
MRTIGAWFLLLMAGVASGSESILIKPGDCESGIHLVAQRAPLSDVLKRLADVLGFQLQLGDSSDSVIDTDISRQPPELIANLSPLDNLVVAQESNPDCPGKYRVVKVWVLPKGGQVSPRAATASLLPRPLTEAEKKLAREGEAMYRRAHGMPPTDEDGGTNQ